MLAIVLSSAFLIAANVADIVTTLRAIGHGAHEANPLLSNKDGSLNLARAIAFKAAVIALVITLGVLSGWMIQVIVGSAVAFTAVAIWNLHN